MAEYVEKVSAAVEPYLGKLRTYLNNDATPDFFVQAVAMASNKTGLSRMSLVLGKPRQRHPVARVTFFNGR
jgi:hypothetical protein